MTVHYAVHIGITPSSKLTGLLRKYHYYRYASSPCVTATHFAKFFSLHTFASMLYSNISSHSLFLKKSRYIMANLPSGSTYPHVLYANQYSVFKVHSAYTPINETKGNSLTCNYATSKSKIFVISFVSNLRRKVSSTQ